MGLFNDFQLPHPDYPGLIAVGGKVTAAKMLAAYREGTFPWYNVGEPVMWWSPDPRAILEFDHFHISHRLARTIRSGKFRCTIDHNFAAVVRGCAEREEETWITPAMTAGFHELHRAGYAHSVEVWTGDELAGGIFGVAIGGFFSGESMFHRQRDASKVALAFLIDHLRAAGYLLFDIQILSPHTASLGAREIPRAEYLQRLKSALGRDVRFPAEAVRPQLSASGKH
jgi:leucyl/phenylalanyl-tRNA--protein transferase